MGINDRGEIVRQRPRNNNQNRKKNSDDDCFIATAATGSSSSWQVIELRRFRDTVLLHHPVGRTFIQWYYHWSPPAADGLRRHHRLQRLAWYGVTAAGGLVKPLVWVASHMSERSPASKTGASG